MWEVGIMAESENVANVFMKLFNGTVNTAEANDDMRKAEGDYYKDGLLYCGKCNTPKEMNPPEETIGFMNRKIPIPCKCMEARMDAENETRKRQQKRMRNEEWMSDLEELGAVCVPYATFSQSDQRDEVLEFEARTYAKYFGQAQQDKNGLIFFGDIGCGKTFYAECIANELIDKGYMVMYSSVSMIADIPKEHKASVMKAVEKCDLLILDDFGAERDTSFMAGQAYEIINARYRAGKKPLVITTNLTYESMASEKDKTYSRTYDRALEMCRRVTVNGSRRRGDIADEKSRKWRELLKTEWQKLKQKQ